MRQGVTRLGYVWRSLRSMPSSMSDELLLILVEQISARRLLLFVQCQREMALQPIIYIRLNNLLYTADYNLSTWNKMPSLYSLQPCSKVAQHKSFLFQISAIPFYGCYVRQRWFALCYLCYLSCLGVIVSHILLHSTPPITKSP